jgi:hypothetical protein
MTTLSNRRQATPPDAHRHPYARLHQAVINRALQDLLQKQRRDEALEWLLSSESDYAFVMAGISPHSLRQQMI